MEAVGRRGFLSRLRIGGDGENGDAGAEQLEEIAACQLEMVERAGRELVAFRFENRRSRRVADAHDLVHLSRPWMALAACCTASTMRGCAPQRQIFPCKN